VCSAVWAMGNMALKRRLLVLRNVILNVRSGSNSEVGGNLSYVRFASNSRRKSAKSDLELGMSVAGVIPDINQGYRDFRV